MLRRQPRCLLATLALVIVAITVIAAQARHPLTGRVYADVMGHSGADWLDRPERALEEAPDLALALLSIRTGMVVADVGAGSGYFTIRLARLVGASGKVFANDIQQEMLTRLSVRVRRERLTNVITVLGDQADPKLPGECCDVILLVDVYHELSQPQQMLRRIRDALKPDGRLVLLEYRKEDPTIPIRVEHKMTIADAKTEVEAEGFRLDGVKENLPRQHVLVFKKAGPRASGSALRN